MDIQRLTKHREFLSRNLEQLGHPFALEQLADPVLADEAKAAFKIWSAKQDAVNLERTANAEFLRNLHDAWLVSGSPKGAEGVAFVAKLIEDSKPKGKP